MNRFNLFFPLLIFLSSGNLYAIGDLPLAIENYRIIAESGGWGHIPHGPILSKGICHRHIARLRTRLRITGDFTGSEPQQPQCMEKALTGAVERFQERHGLKHVDGRVGPSTREHLNIPVGVKIKRMEMNLSKPTSVPDGLPDHFIWVNVAGFELRVIERGEETLRMKVITGKTTRQTPEFAHEIQHVVFNPYWNVPPIIVHRDILPVAMKDPTYFDRKGFRVFKSWDVKNELNYTDVNWSKFSWRENKVPYVIRQDPGEDNFLGKIKFLFPNRYGVYLHDTPAKSLFDAHQRTFSSGCVRVHDPIALAAHLLDKTALEMQEMVDSGEHKWVALDKKVPIFITYQTVWVEDDGTVHFRDDFYKRETWSREDLTCNAGSVHNTCSEEINLSEVM